MKEMIAYQIEKHDSSIEGDSYVSDIFNKEEIVKRISFALQVDKRSVTVRIEPDDKEPLEQYQPRLTLDYAYPGVSPLSVDEYRDDEYPYRWIWVLSLLCLRCAAIACWLQYAAVCLQICKSRRRRDVARCRNKRIDR